MASISAEAVIVAKVYCSCRSLFPFPRRLPCCSGSPVVIWRYLPLLRRNACHVWSAFLYRARSIEVFFPVFKNFGFVTVYDTAVILPCCHGILSLRFYLGISFCSICLGPSFSNKMTRKDLPWPYLLFLLSDLLVSTSSRHNCSAMTMKWGQALKNELPCPF